MASGSVGVDVICPECQKPISGDAFADAVSNMRDAQKLPTIRPETFERTVDRMLARLANAKKKGGA